MAGIKDIAKKAGCSISTVSYALNGSPKVTEETRKKILKIANDLDYVPNGAARMLRAGQTKIVGCFLSDYSGSFYGRLLKGMRETLNEQGYELVVCSGKESRRLLLEKMMDGAIILDEAFTDEELLNYANLGHKMVILDRELEHKNIKTVLIDNQKGAALAASQLLKHQTQDLYIVSGPSGSYDSNQRMEAAEKVVKASGSVNVTVIEGDFTKESGIKAAQKMVAQYREPTAVFCLNDEMAVGFYDYIKETAYVIGKDFYVVGFDNIELAQYVQPRLTTINFSASGWGRVVTKNLLKLLLNQYVDHEKIAVELIKGDSCGV